MEQYMLKSLKKLRKEVPRRFKELRSLCDETINILVEAEAGRLKITDTAKYFEPLKLACDSRQPRLMEIGLDAIHFLIEHGYLRSSQPTSHEVESDVIMNSVSIEKIIQCASGCSDEYDEVVQLQVIKVLLTAVTSSHCEVHEANLLLAVRSCFHIHLISKNQVNKNTAKAALTHMLSVISQRMEVHDAEYRIRPQTSHGYIADFSKANPEVLPENEKKEVEEEDGHPDNASTHENNFVSVYHKDAFLTFRAICKISMKGLHDESGSQYDPIALQNKILSLELIQHILTHSGLVFQSDENILSIVRDILCVSLLGNCTSQIAQVTGLSLQIFVSLLRSFKDHLKSELEVFVTGIFLRILESENSTYEHKLRVLEVFHIICRDPTALVEIFINYDCDFEAIDLFRRIVDGFAKIAKNPSSSFNRSTMDFISASGKKGQDEHLVRYMGLEGLVIILKSLHELGGVPSKSNDSFADLGNSTKASSTDGLITSTINDEDVAAEVSADKNNMVEVFDRKQKMQEEIETGILKFNLSPKKGLAYLASLQHIEYTPAGVAKFLIQYQDRLDKAVVGEFLGREREYENGFCTKVLHEYVDSMDFTNLAFDMAIRRFLNGFRLPGEAQKIDRMMEKFAERYYIQNRDKFASADMAFILAFSTIMLQTNLHNPAIREDKRMTKEQFIRQNKGISSDGEIPDDVLVEIYDRIAAEPIRISHEEKLIKRNKKEEQAFAVFAVSQDRRRKDAFNSERMEMVKTSEALFKQKSKRISQFFRKSSTNDEMYARPMFEVIWAPILGVFSQVLEFFEDDSSVTLCLTGIQSAIHLSCRLDIPVARDTFINALVKFTTLDSVREMQDKNILCIKALLEVAVNDKDYIDESWIQILQCISQLARLQLFASGLHTDDMFFSDTASVLSSEHSSVNITGFKRRQLNLGRYTDRSTNSVSMDPFGFFSGPSRAEIIRQVEEANADMIMREVSPDIIDQVFFNSQYLSEQSVWHFVKSLCEVSMLEINTSSSMHSFRGKDSSLESITPRVFSLQKLVEVADFNMHSRPRIAWANLWNMLANYFATIGVSDNVALSMYAVDSLKQLSIKFLQKEELTNFNFQRVFLKPFEIVIAKSKFIEIKDLVLRCIDIMIRACAPNIRSGWRSIFTILEVAAGQDVSEISTIAFETVERLMTNQFDLLIFDFVELMNCLVSFVSGKHKNISLRALTYLGKCADHLAEGKVSPALYLQHISTDSMGISWEKSRNAVNTIDSYEATNIDASVFRLWWPLLLGLSTRVGDSRFEVRSGALNTLGQVLRKYGSLFSLQTWSVIFKGVLFPMMDSAKTDFSQQPISAFPSQAFSNMKNNNSWIGTTAEHVLSICLEMFYGFKENTKSLSLLSDLLNMLESCICQDTEILSRMALRALNELLLSEDKKLCINDDSIQLIARKLKACMLQNICFDFSDHGILDFIHETPEDIRSLVRNCPLSIRRQMKTMKIRESISKRDDTNRVKTMYGEGSLEQIVDSDSKLQIPVRHVVRLAWGTMYTFPESYTLISSVSTSTAPWDQIRLSIMTSMVASLEIIRIVGDELLQALEVLYWHSRSFNHQVSLRMKLHKANFMKFSDDHNRLPHLLEQEVFSLSKLLEISLAIQLKSETKELQDYGEILFHRMMKMCCCRYLALEEGLATSSSSYDNDAHDAYGAAVLIALQGVRSMNVSQFKRCFSWASDLLAQMIMCDDVDVRSCISDIYIAQINPLVQYK